MHRIDGAGHVDHMFVAEDPATLRPPTEITPEIMNAFQEELATFIEWAGMVLAKGDNTQLKQALVAKFAGLDVAATKAGVQAQTYTAFTTTGATGAFALTPNPAIGAYAAGQRFRVKFHTAGNSADTINVSALGNKSLKQYDSAGAKIAAVIAANQLADIEYDGVDMVILDPLPTSPKGKSFVINGNFDIWQRNTNFALTTSGSNYTADRWLANIGTNGNNSTISRQAFALGQAVVPNEPTYWLRYAVTAFVGGTPSLEQRIESVRTFAGKQVTISFWAKADAARSVSVSLNQVFGTGGAPSGGVNTQMGVFNLTAVWQQFSANVTVPSINGKTLGTNGDDYLQLLFVLPGATCTIDIAQVQLEEGGIATGFDKRLAQQELALCQRYYEKSYDFGVAPGALTFNGSISLTLGTGTVERLLMQYKVPKRAIPTVITYSPGTGAISKAYCNGSDQPCGLNNGSVTGVQAVNSGTIYRDFSVHFTADAEL